MSISPIGIFENHLKEETFKDDSFIERRQPRNYININNKDMINANKYNNPQINHRPPVKNPNEYEEKIVPRKLQFSEASFSKLNLSRRKVNFSYRYIYLNRIIVKRMNGVHH